MKHVKTFERFVNEASSYELKVLKMHLNDALALLRKEEIDHKEKDGKVKDDFVVITFPDADSLEVAKDLLSAKKNQHDSYLKESDSIYESVSSYIVKNHGNGVVINDVWKRWNEIETKKDWDSWASSVKDVKFGTYGTTPFLDTLEKFEPKYPNEILKRNFIEEIKQALQ